MRVLHSLSLVVFLTSATATMLHAQTKPTTTPGAKAAAATAALPKATASAPAPANDNGKPASSVSEQAKTETKTEAKNDALPSDGFSYDPGGRRDPFLTLIGPSTDTRSRKGEGASGMAVAELSVRGVLEARGRLVAMVKGPDNKTYIVHQGDRLLDGAIKSITPQGLVIEQEVNDPLSVVKQREVRKLLRGLEETK
jgi:Tfp pilus assembly protein PilP